MMVRDFQSIIGDRDPPADAGGRRPPAGFAGSPASAAAPTRWGLFHPFLDDPSVEIFGVEAGGHGLTQAACRPRSPAAGPGVLHGNRTYLPDGR
jgi:tryptophan synthase beta chain